MLGIHAGDLDTKLRHLTRAAVRAAWFARSCPDYPDLGRATSVIVNALGSFGHAALQAGCVQDAGIALELLLDVDPADACGLQAAFRSDPEPGRPRMS